MSSSWVMRMIVLPSELRRLNICMNSALVVVSRLPVGSSASTSAGLVTIALASATRCCCPPDISLGKCELRSPIPTASSAAAARARRSFVFTPA